ncbi:hypothetical protein HYV80_04835 [Candidatus Woesearchaeota archaeon]|nr:hypothetical protein [Candidatus Woesearchaeota archaeon]
MRHKKIKSLVEDVIRPSVSFIKKSRKRKNMPFKEIETILKIFFPKTKHHESSKGFFKHVFVIHSRARKIVLKIGRSKKHIRKDYTTYTRLPENIRNRYFAKIYWKHDFFMLQKYGKKAKVPERELHRLKDIGRKYGLKDIREANIMKFDNKFKIVDAERR